MSSSRNAARRSGDPRRRNATARSSGTGRRTWVALAALGAGGAVLALGLAALGSDAQEPADARGREHAEAACVLTAQAGEAATSGEARRADARARYAAAVLLLDRAIIESARAAESDPGLTDLDLALQAVHTAGHSGDPDGWESALGEALTECRSSTS